MACAGTILKASLALRIGHVWPRRQRELCQARPALLQLFKITNRPSAVLSAAGLYWHHHLLLQHNYRYIERRKV